MKKLKVMTILGTRPEIIRLARVMARLEDHVDHVVTHTGQNWDCHFRDYGAPHEDPRVSHGGGQPVL